MSHLYHSNPAAFWILATIALTGTLGLTASAVYGLRALRDRLRAASQRCDFLLWDGELDGDISPETRALLERNRPRKDGRS